MKRDPHCKSYGKESCACSEDWSWKMVISSFFVCVVIIALFAAIVGGCSYDNQQKRDLVRDCLKGNTIAGQVTRTPADCHNGVYDGGR